MTFEEYLKSKKIDPKKFSADDPNRYNEFERLFNEMHPKSFTAQKLFLINQLRRKFMWSEAEESQPKKTVQKPKIIPRIKK